jgi:septal ring factor EnvC (AmiA/AmiB activator)
VWSQSSSEKLKNEQARLEKKIASTKMLLKKTQNNTTASLNELKVIENQILFREQLLKNFDNQIRGAELKVEKKELEIGELQERVGTLKMQYKKILLYAYKQRNKYGKMMFIFSADSYFEAIKRNKYLQKIAEIQKKQFTLIKQHQSLIKEEIANIETQKALKLNVIKEKKSEKEAIAKDKVKQEEIYQNFRQEEDKLLAKLREDEKDKAILSERIAAAIRKEIAEAEARRKKEEAARKAELAAAAASNAESTATTASTIDFAETKESEALSKSFEGNRGRLPWPVEKGTVTENFGKNPHATLKNVYTNNRGIDISAPKNAQVRAVFEGEVTSVLNIPGAGKVVIIKHGNYRTVYSNLQETYVKTGQKVSTKKVIGSLLVKDSNISVAHFEIHQVSGSEVTCLNPSLWVTQ